SRVEVVYPPISIRGEARVVLADSNADHRDTRAVARDLVRFLYSGEGQEIIARHHYRSVRPGITRLPDLELFGVQDLFPDGSRGQERFFGKGGPFDQIRTAKR